MNIEVFVLCDAATDSQGKLNILGAFDAIYAQEMPTIHPQCAIALRLRLNPAEHVAHKLNLTIVGPTGESIIPPFAANFSGGLDQLRESTAVNFIFNLQGLKIDKCGTYSINLAIDDVPLGSLPLYAKTVAQPIPQGMTH